MTQASSPIITPAPQTAANVSALDRLSFTVFLALALHALLLFGVGFNFGRNNATAPTLDVTLVHHSSEETQDDADFLAQANQQGSGTEDEADLLQTTEEAEFEDNTIRRAQPEQQTLLIKESAPEQVRVITAQRSLDRLPIQLELVEETPEANASVDHIVLQQTHDIATLKAILSDKRQRYAARPRIRTLTAVSTRRADDAAYVFRWLEKIERIGNLNYPQAARQNKLEGDVRMLVSLLPNGTVNKVEVLSSSGHQILDDAAKRIVRLASPFEPFPETIKETTDVLEIIRTWRFISNLSLDTQS